MLHDIRGYPIDSDNAACVENFDKAIARFFEFRLDAVELHANGRAVAQSFADCCWPYYQGRVKARWRTTKS